MASKSHPAARDCAIPILMMGETQVKPAAVVIEIIAQNTACSWRSIPGAIPGALCRVPIVQCVRGSVSLELSIKRKSTRGHALRLIESSIQRGVVFVFT